MYDIRATPIRRSIRKFLQLVSAADRPVSWSEIGKAIAIINKTRSGPGIQGICFPFSLVKGSDDGFVDFHHFTVEEFFRYLGEPFPYQVRLLDEKIVKGDDECSIQSSNFSSIFSIPERASLISQSSAGEMLSVRSSNVPSIFSKTGGASLNSQSPAGEMLSVMDEMVDLLANDEVLRPLYHAAIENEAIGGHHFGRNFPHLLKLCSEELKREAHENFQWYVVKLFRSRAAYFSNRLRAMHDPVYENMAKEMRKLDVRRNERSGPEILEKYLQDGANPAPRNEPHQATEAKQDDIPADAEHDDVASQSTDQESEPDQDQMNQPNLINIKKFFLSSSAFANLRNNFQQFVRHHEKSRTPPEVTETHYPTEQSAPHVIYAEGHQTTSSLSHRQLTMLKTSQTFMIRTIASLRWFVFTCASMISDSYDQRFEPAVDRDKVRIRWECPCGRMLWDDFRELRPGAAEDLRRSLDSYKKTMSAQETCDSQQIPNSYTIGTYASTVSVKTVASNAGTSSQSSTAAAATDGAVLTDSLSLKLQNDPKFLLLCFRKPRDTLRLHQLRVDDITTDFQLFRLLRDTYRAYQGLSGRLLKPRRIRSVVFRKVSRLL